MPARSVYSARDNALVDYYVVAFWHGKEKKLSSQRHSAFFSLMHQLLDNCRQGMSLAENKKFLQTSLLQNTSDTVRDEDGLIYDFDPPTMRIALEFAMTGILSHHRLYQHMLSTEQGEASIAQDVTVELPPFLNPLEEAVDETLWAQHIDPDRQVNARLPRPSRYRTA